MESFSSGEAALALAKAQNYEDGLRQRTEGITQMVWGTITSAMFVTYGFAAVIEATEVAMSLLWLPWVVIGSVMTYALWRSAALVNRTRTFDKPGGPLVRMILVSVAISAVFAIAQPDGPTLALGVVGAVWTAMAALNVFHASQRGRVLWAGSGLAILGCALALGLLDAGVEEAGTVAMVAPALVCLTTGLWQTLQP